MARKPKLTVLRRIIKVNIKTPIIVALGADIKQFYATTH